MSLELFSVDPEKVKYLYEIQNDNTSIDNCIIDIKKELGDKIKGISVKGLTSGPNNFVFKQLPYGFKQIALYWEAKEYDKNKVRSFNVYIYINYDKFPFRLCNMNWVDPKQKRFPPPTEDNYNFNRDRAYDLVETVLQRHANFFLVSVFCGVLPHSTWSTRCYIKIIMKIPVSGNDVFEQSSIPYLTDFGKSFRVEIRDEFCKIIEAENVSLNKLYTNKKLRDSIARKAENIVRGKMGLKNVGDAFVNETLLANIILDIFPDTIRQYRQAWLGKYVLDIYIPSLNLAIEYHGEQHYKAIDRFGGVEKFLKQQKRDEFVRNKCSEFKVSLLEWSYTERVTKDTVCNKLCQYGNLPLKEGRSL